MDFNNPILISDFVFCQNCITLDNNKDEMWLTNYLLSFDYLNYVNVTSCLKYIVIPVQPIKVYFMNVDNFAFLRKFIADFQNNPTNATPPLHEIQKKLDEIEEHSRILAAENVQLQDENQELRSRITHFETIIDHFPNGMLAAYDTSLRYTSIGGEGLPSAGLSKDMFEGKRLRDVFPPEVYDRDEPALQAALNGETIESIIPYNEGTYRVLTSPVKKDNDIIGGIVMSQDISDIFMTEQRFTTLFNTASIGIVMINTDGIILLANDHMVNLLGYTTDEITGMKLNKLLPDDLQTSHDTHIEGFFNDPRPREMGKGLDLQAQRKDGTVFPIEVSLATVDGQLGKQAVAFVADISERKQLEQQLQEREQLYSTLIASLPDAIMIIQDGYHVFCNMSCARMVGLESLKDIVGRPAMDFIAEQDRERIQNYIQHTSQNNGGNAIEVQISRSDGSQFPAEARAKPILYGNREAIMIVAQDISERKLVQKQTIELQLEREKFKVLKAFIQDASHDFRTPLATILSSTHILKHKFSEESTVARIDKIERQAKRIDDLLDDMFTYMKVELSSDTSLSRIDIAQFLQAEVAQWRSYADTNQLTLTLETNSNLPVILANHHLLQRALKELLMNAAQFTPEGGQIVVRGFEKEGTVAIEIQDSGKGIGEKHLPHIFKRFYRGDEARGVETGGTGLGLALVQLIVQQHGGEITVSTVVGQGTTFCIFLPRSTNE